ncbi:Sulfite oxidase [Metarhizium anisopliae BRIP 53293]|uniref:Nitrate reductase [NADPH] n=1 Tax=Metarhizium anisopliae BRIP 53293 TaxID=1291518 RepID=A0A0D9P0M6_METAN|nr:Sulfite oxidase [Metarhizium anisopliae BRIP 53293]
MNPRHHRCISQRLFRLHISHPRPTADFFPTAVHRRVFSSSVPRSAEAGRHSGGPASRVSAVRHSVRPRSQIAAAIASLGLLSLALCVYPSSPTTLDAHYASSPPVSSSSFKPEPAPAPENPSDNRDPDLPRFRIAEVRKHGADSDHPWVIYGDKVYDITDWIPAHPGGQVILRAAGGSIDPYWNIFTIHKNQYVYDILSQYLIGYVDQADLVNGKPAQDQIEDPFENDPERHPSLITRTAKPRNAETPAEALSAQFLTPNELFYVRNHMWVPTIEDSKSDDYRLTVELLDGTMKEYTLRELKTRFPSRKVTAVLQCSGNRRKHMSDDSGRQTNGLPWTSGAISNASWEGVLLSDVLADAGFDLSEAMSGSSETQHVQFMGLEAYGASIPIKKAIDPQGDVLLAYSMNDKPLPRDHGFPLRAIVPGHVAARSVKWLNHITLSDEESTSQWQRKDYKCFGPNQTKVDWDAAPAIQELPVQSAITTLKLGKWLDSKIEPNVLKNDQDQAVTSQNPPQQEISMSGYAFSGGGRSIIRVDVSLDGGGSWTQAYLLPDCVSKNGMPSPCRGHGAWSWKRWVFEGSVPLDTFKEKHGGRPDDPVTAAANSKTPDSGQKRCTTVLVKATDDAYNTQPESHAATWNFRGNLATAWHRVQVCTDCSRATANGNSAQEK